MVKLKIISNIQHGISNDEGKKEMSEKENKFDLQECFIDYVVKKLLDSDFKTKAGKHISFQMLRSGTSPTANYGEAQSAESKADLFIN